MSRVEKTTTVVQKPVTEERYVFTLTVDEALVFHSLLGNCTSNKSDYDTYDLYNELDNALDCPELKYEVREGRSEERINSILLRTRSVR